MEVPEVVLESKMMDVAGVVLESKIMDVPGVVLESKMMDVPGVVLESPASPDEILFIEDRRPGNVSPIFENLKSKPLINETPELITEDFIKLSNDGEDQNFDTNFMSGTDKINVRHQMDTEDTVQLEDGLCFVIEDRNPQLTGDDTQSPKYKINENYLKLHASKDLPKKARFINPCFNCGETEHIIRDCPHPKDQRKISRNKKEFMDSKSHVPVYRRYHKDGHDSFEQCTPGEISTELREALGLEDNELPAHTYLMRLHGYPPGWLQEALVSHSGISMFDGQGKEVEQPGTEQGENKTTDQDKYDIRKIINYPGFNVPPPPGAHDDCNYWRCPPFSERQSVESMVKMLANRVVGGYKRKKLSLNATSLMDDSLQSAESHDMEYEETPENVELPEDHCKFVPPLPDQDLPPPPPSESPESPPPIVESPESPDPDPSQTDTESQSLLSAEETSLLELVEQKKLLLAQLNDVSPTCGTPNSKVGKTKTIEFGTPILKSVSPFARLPSSDKFSVNICDVINFENLPDSTGKYKQMSGIIKKVRNTLKQYSE